MIEFWLGYFVMACVVLFFRRLCSECPEPSSYNHGFEGWWFKTICLILAWPIFAPLAGAYRLGKMAREGIEKHNARLEQIERDSRGL